MSIIVDRDIKIHSSDKSEMLSCASYVRADDNDYFVISINDTHIAYVLNTELDAGDYKLHNVLVAAHYARFRDAVAHVDIQYHVDTCENDAVLLHLSHSLTHC